jgi:hypothetical protein
MQSTNIKEIKAALWRQAFIGDTWVSCGDQAAQGAASGNDPWMEALARS